jgi:hypothetical protein
VKELQFVVTILDASHEGGFKQHVAVKVGLALVGRVYRIERDDERNDHIPAHHGRWVWVNDDADDHSLDYDTEGKSWPDRNAAVWALLSGSDVEQYAGVLR